MERRRFLRSAGAAAIASVAAAPTLRAAADAAAPAENAAQRPNAGNRFKLKYAPHFGMFRNHAPGGVLDELKFMADQGFTALEDNGMRGRPKDEQEKIGREMARLGMTMGVFVANPENAFGSSGFASGDAATREQF
jgi:hydroxypyruvate isomerase